MFYVSGRSDGVVVEAAAQVVGAPAAAARWSHARRRRPRTSVAHRSAFTQTHWMTGATHRRVGGPAIRFGGWVAKNARGPWPRTAQLVDGAACEDDSYLKTAQRCRPAPGQQRPRQPGRFYAVAQQL